MGKSKSLLVKEELITVETSIKWEELNEEGKTVQITKTFKSPVFDILEKITDSEFDPYFLVYLREPREKEGFYTVRARHCLLK